MANSSPNISLHGLYTPSLSLVNQRDLRKEVALLRFFLSLIQLRKSDSFLHAAPGNDKNALWGIIDAISRKHALCFPAGFGYRFNWLFDLHSMYSRLLFAALFASPMPMRVAEFMGGQARY